MFLVFGRRLSGVYELSEVNWEWNTALEEMGTAEAGKAWTAHLKAEEESHGCFREPILSKD